MKKTHFDDRQSRPKQPTTWQRTWLEIDDMRFCRYTLWKHTECGTAYQSFMFFPELERHLIAGMVRDARRAIRDLIAKGPPWA